MSSYHWEWFDTCPTCGAPAKQPCTDRRNYGIHNKTPLTRKHKGRHLLPQDKR